MSENDPLTTSIPCCRSSRALGESRLRVRAPKVGAFGCERRARMTAPPCLPVAPVTRIRVGIATVRRNVVKGRDKGTACLREAPVLSPCCRERLTTLSRRPSRELSRGSAPREKFDPDVRRSRDPVIAIVQRRHDGTKSLATAGHSRTSTRDGRDTRPGRTEVYVQRNLGLPSIPSWPLSQRGCGRGSWTPSRRLLGTAIGTEPGTGTAAGRTGCRLRGGTVSSASLDQSDGPATHRESMPRHGRMA